MVDRIILSQGRFPEGQSGLHRMAMSSYPHQHQHAYGPLVPEPSPAGSLLHYQGPGINQPPMRHCMVQGRQQPGHVGGISHGARYPSPPQQQQQQQQQHHHPQYMGGSPTGGGSPAQLTASMHLQKLTNQYYGYPPHYTASPVHLGHQHQSMPTHQQLYRDCGVSKHVPSPAHLRSSPPGHPGATLACSSVIDTDYLDEEVLMSLVVEMGLDRVQELPELWLGQNEFDFVTEFVCKQHNSRVSC
eukprot:gi/632991119/ref/XP_007884480.1/ PREDICTED: cbp/p300-interacting transactivator 2-like [Callorhinchus milii]